jgi:hypothetical protein
MQLADDKAQDRGYRLEHERKDMVQRYVTIRIVRPEDARWCLTVSMGKALLACGRLKEGRPLFAPKIRLSNIVALEKLGGSALEGDSPKFDDIASVGYLEGFSGILLDEQNRSTCTV